MFIERYPRKRITTYSSTQSFTGYCAANQTGGPITRSATATSTVSQGEADSLALAAATAQVNALLLVSCVAIDSSTSPAWQIDPATEVCDVSVNKKPFRDSKAQMKDVNPASPTYNTYRNSGQLYFYKESSPACPNPFTSASYSIQFTKSNCPVADTGSTDILTVGAGAFTSLIGQGEADLKAYTYLNQHGSGIYNGTIAPEAYPAYDNNAIPKNFPIGTCSIPETGSVRPTLAVYAQSTPDLGYVVITLSRELFNANAKIINGTVGIFNSANVQLETRNFSISSGSNETTASTTFSPGSSGITSYYAKVTSVLTSGYTPSSATVSLT